MNRRSVLAAAVLAVPALLIGVGVAYARTDQDPAITTAEEIEFPRPGGGRQAIHVYTPPDGNYSYLLDTNTGEYHRLPYLSVVLSPDRQLVAIETDGRIGVAHRRALLRTGEQAIRWTDLPGGSPAWWSPDGTALLVTTLDKETATFTAHRYDLRTGRIRQTPIDRLDCEICVAGWAPDSTRYLVMLRSPDPAVLEGPIQYLNPDGTPGPRFGVDGIIREGDAYSPSGRHVIVEPVRPTGVEPPPVIFDLRTGTVTAAIDTRQPIVGWYDRRRVVRIGPGDTTVLEVVDIRTGEVSRRVPAPDLHPYRIQLGPAPRHGAAAELGF